MHPSVRLIGILVAVASAVTAVAARTQQAAPRPDPLVRANATQQVSDHVFVIPDNNVVLVPNVGIVVGSQAALVIDTGMGRRNGMTVRQEAQKVVGNRALFLATTHVHPEHDLGASAFPATVKMIRSEDQVREIARDGLQVAERFSAGSAITAELLKGEQFRPADITFKENYTLDLGGGVRVRLMAMGFNHTLGDTIFFVEPDRVLFSGDVLMSRVPVNVTAPRERVQHWLSSLDTLAALQPKLIVPSHGPTGDSAWFAPYRAHFQKVLSGAQ